MIEKIKTVVLQDGQYSKTFYVKKMPCSLYFTFTNSLTAMLAETNAIKPFIFKQFINNRLMNGNIEPELTREKVKPEDIDRAVEKEATTNPQELFFDLIQSIISNVETRQHDILNTVLANIDYQNGSTRVPLSYLPGDGCIDLILDDNDNLYKLVWEFFIFNYGKYLSFLPKHQSS